MPAGLQVARPLRKEPGGRVFKSPLRRRAEWRRNKCPVSLAARHEGRMQAGLQVRATGFGREVGRSSRPSHPQGCGVAQKRSRHSLSPKLGRTNACRTTLVVAVRIRATDRKVCRESCSHLSSDLSCQRRMLTGLQVDAAPPGWPKGVEDRSLPSYSAKWRKHRLANPCRRSD